MQPTDPSAVVEALRAGDRFVVTSHENPDGDALGSLLATHLALEALGKDSVMVLGGEAPLPGEYAFLELEARGLVRSAPPDAGERVLVAVDCAQESRIVEQGADRGGAADREHRPPSRQHALRGHRPRRRRRIVHRGGARGCLRRARGRADARDRGGALHGGRHGHGPFPVLEHDAQGAPSGRSSSSRQVPT